MWLSCFIPHCHRLCQCKHTIQFPIVPWYLCSQLFSIPCSLFSVLCSLFLFCFSWDLEWISILNLSDESLVVCSGVYTVSCLSYIYFFFSSTTSFSRLSYLISLSFFSRSMYVCLFSSFFLFFFSWSPQFYACHFLPSLFSSYKAISPSSLWLISLSSSLPLWLSGSLKTSISFFLFSPFLSRYFYNDDFFLFLFLF